MPAMYQDAKPVLLTIPTPKTYHDEVGCSDNARDGVFDLGEEDVDLETIFRQESAKPCKRNTAITACAKIL